MPADRALKLLALPLLAVCGCAPGEPPVQRELREAFGARAARVLDTGDQLPPRLFTEGARSLVLSSKQVEVRVTPLGAGPLRASPRGATADREGGASFFHWSAQGLEEWLYFRARPGRLAWAVEGLFPRASGDAVLLVDGAGVSHFRVTAPEAWDARGPLAVALGVERGEVVLSVPASAQPPLLIDPLWVATSGQPFVAREHAVLLPGANGTLLVAGGLDLTGAALAGSELYTPGLDNWSPGPPLLTGRGRSATDGTRVLGGIAVVARDDVEFYDLDAGTFVSQAPLLQSRAEAAALPLPGGGTLVVGGRVGGVPLALTEVLASDGGWTLGSSLLVARAGPTATLLLDGRVLVTGGSGASGALASTEVRELDAGWRAGPAMAFPRARHTATLLSSGDVLIVGGDGDAGVSAELFSSATSSFGPAASPRQPRVGHTATVLPGGKVLVAGGRGATAAEVFDPALGTFTVAGCLVRPRESHVAAALDGGVLLAFGRDSAGLLAHSERFVPVGGAAQGTVCTADCQCAAGFCVGGVCCDRACQGACEACAASTGACGLATAGKVCRPADGGCDVPDVCTGLSPLCTADVVQDAGTVCRASGGACDAPEVCDGVQPTCGADVLVGAGVACRPADGGCDVAELCSGSTAQCPADAVRPSGTFCRASLGLCDTAETCDGVAHGCPLDALAAAGTVCRLGDGGCDAPETCTGTSVSCPADLAAPAGFACRPALAACDLSEVCDGVSRVCPPDAFAGAARVCRPQGGPCDKEERCTGAAPTCPADLVFDAGILCRTALGGCDLAEFCTGFSKTCPLDAVRAPGAVCRAAVGPCDAPETCDGDGGQCPADVLANTFTVCRPAVALCDAVEYCTGASSLCPADQRLPPGAVCRGAGGACDVAERCDTSIDCPPDFYASQATACGGYLCSGDRPACPSACAGDAGCAPGFACARGLCEESDAGVPPQRYVGWGLGCGATGSGPAPLLLALTLALFARRRAVRAAVPLLLLGWVALAPSTARAAAHEAGWLYTGEEGHRGFAIRLQGLFLKDLLASNIGGEVGAAVAVHERFDVGAWVSLGRYPGARLGVTLHSLDEGERLRPFAQLRGVLHPVPDGVAVGAGLFTGLTVALGPGRVVLGLLFEGYAGPRTFVPAGLFVLLGYELDVYRAHPVRQQLVQAPPAPVEKAGDTPQPLVVPPTSTPPPVAPAPVEPAAKPTAPPVAAAVPPALPAPEEPRTKVVTRLQIREQLLFGDKQVKLDPRLAAQAERFAQALAKLTQVKKLEVSGHADDAADDEKCVALSQKRAEAVLEALVKGGVERERLLAKGYGRARPLAPLSGPARKREKNRRVEFSVLEQDKSP